MIETEATRAATARIAGLAARPAHRPLWPTLVRAGLAAAAIAAAYWAYDTEIDTRTIAAPEPGSRATVPTGSVGAGAERAAGLRDFRATLERPVFEPDRRPRPAAPASPRGNTTQVAAEPPSVAGLRVVGVMKGAKGEPRALLRTSGAAQAEWVSPGAEAGGWTVARIGERSVQLEAQGHRIELGLYGAEPAADSAQQ